MKLRFFCFGLSLAAMLAAASCGGSGGGPGGMEPGTLGIFIADGPPDASITRVEIDLDWIEAYLAGHWVRIEKTAGTINLLDHIDTPYLAATAPVSSGQYSQLKLFLSGARVEDGEGCHEIELPPAVRNGIAINLPFTIHGGIKNDLLLDFDVARSIVRLGPGQYDLRPFVLAVNRREAGSVFGTVERDDCAVPGLFVKAVYLSGDRATVGQTINMGRTREAGSYRIWALPPGGYRIDFERRDEFGNLRRLQSLSDVTVRAGEDSDLGVFEWPRREMG